MTWLIVLGLFALLVIIGYTTESTEKPMSQKVEPEVRDLRAVYHQYYIHQIGRPDAWVAVWVLRKADIDLKKGEVAVTPLQHREIISGRYYLDSLGLFKPAQYNDRWPRGLAEQPKPSLPTKDGLEALKALPAASKPAEPKRPLFSDLGDTIEIDKNYG